MVIKIFKYIERCRDHWCAQGFICSISCQCSTWARTWLGLLLKWLDKHGYLFLRTILWHSKGSHLLLPCHHEKWKVHRCREPPDHRLLPPKARCRSQGAYRGAQCCRAPPQVIYLDSKLSCFVISNASNISPILLYYKK